MTTDYTQHQYWTEFLLQVLRTLHKGESPRDIAAHVREAIKKVYGHPIPSGAELSMNVNDICNLQCRHCYYASTHDKQLEQKMGVLSSEEWMQLIDSSLSAGFRHFSIIGKEPLLSPKQTKVIFSKLESRKKEFPEIKYELITNGILVEEKIDWLRELDFYFFSISFDGAREQHDMIRGDGSYEKSREGLRLLKEAGLRNLTVSHTVMQHNVDSLEEMILELSEVGAEYFSLNFFFPTEQNDNKYLLQPENTINLIIKQLKDLPEHLDISINVSAEEEPSLLWNLYKGFLPGREVAVTEDLAPSLILPLSDSPRTSIHLNFLPVMYYSGFRVHCDGTAIDFCSELQKPGKVAGFGNVRETAVDELWGFARDTLWKNYTERYYEKLVRALG